MIGNQSYTLFHDPYSILYCCNMNFTFKHGIIGGTFDHLHLGHQKLIDTAFNQSEQVTIGLTRFNMYQQKVLADTIQAYEIREDNLKKYFAEKNLSDRVKIIPITDIYGTTLTDQTIEAIFATAENEANL